MRPSLSFLPELQFISEVWGDATDTTSDSTTAAAFVSAMVTVWNSGCKNEVSFSSFITTLLHHMIVICNKW